MNKDKRGKKQVKVFFLIANMILATFAFSYLVGATSRYVIIDELKDVPAEATEVQTMGDGRWSYVIDDSAQPANKRGDSPVSPTQAAGMLPLAAGPGKQILGAWQSSIVKFGGGYEFPGVTGTAHSAKALGNNQWQLLDQQGAPIGTINQADLVSSGLNPELLKGGYNFNGITEMTNIKEVYGKSLTGYQTADGKAFLDPDTGKVYTATNGKWTEAGVSATNTKGTTYLSQAFGATRGQFWDAALSGLEWAAIAYGLGQMIGGMAGMDTSQTKALSNAMSAGTFTKINGVFI